MNVVSLDTNILAYFIGVYRSPGDPAKIETVRQLMRLLGPRVTLDVSTQALAELYNLLAKTALSRGEAFDEIERVRGYAAITPASDAIFRRALEFACFNRFQIFDAIILAAANTAGARALLSEDMQDGSTWSGTMIVNPLLRQAEECFALLIR